MRKRSWRAGYAILVAAACGLGASPLAAQPPTDAVIRVVDVGPGLCVIIVAPGGAMLYDAGPPGAWRCVDAVQELVPGGRLDLVVLSHSDNDHVSMIPALLAQRLDRRRRPVPRLYRADVIIHPGDPRGPALTPVRRSIDEQARLGARVFNLFAIDNPRRGRRAPTPIRPGDSFAVGAGRATFVAGWSNGNETRGPGEAMLRDGPLNNALSIVIRFDYGGRSVLLTGDTVGRMLRDPPGTCEYAERIMTENAARVRIESDVLIGQHHGADNSTSSCFARAVNPEFVVFSAGHHFRHPTQAAVNRLIASGGVSAGNIFRTDRGDNEGGGEMTAGSGSCKDVRGDDDVEIRLPQSPSGRVTVAYRNPSADCAP